MLEKDFQSKLIKDIKKEMPNCIVLKTDPDYIQGIPDLLILNDDKWAALEIKRNDKAKKRPNQEYYVNIMNRMSFAKFVSPENKKEVFDELCKTLQSRRSARISRSK